MIQPSVSEVGSQIHWIRGHQVILDNALATYYNVETRALKRAVRRNRARFPDDFMLELSELEMKTLMCQIGTSKPSNTIDRRGGNRHTPFAFTEAGVAMLSSVLKSDLAVQVNIAIIRAFISLRNASNNQNSSERGTERLENRLGQLEDKLSQVLAQVNSLSKPEVKESDRKQEGLNRPTRLVEPFEKIQTVVTKHFGLEEQTLCLAGRKKSIVLPRQIAIYLTRKHTDMGLKEIGRAFGGRDHTTILSAYRKIADSLSKDEKIREAVRTIEAALL